MPVTTARMERGQLLRLFRYHHWAADQLFGALSDLSAADLDAQWGGSFGTGRALLQHVLGAERLWVERWNHRPASVIPVFPATHTGADFRADWERIRNDQQRYIESTTGDVLASPLTYTNIRGQVKTYMMDDLLLHVVNHGTYHRGQISQLLRDRGRSSPSTDMILYYDVESAGDR